MTNSGHSYASSSQVLFGVSSIFIKSTKQILTCYELLLQNYQLFIIM